MIKTTELKTGVRVTYQTDKGQASAVVVGDSMSAVEERKSEIVENHNLKNKVQE